MFVLFILNRSVGHSPRVRPLDTGLTRTRWNWHQWLKNVDAGCMSLTLFTIQAFVYIFEAMLCRLAPRPYYIDHLSLETNNSIQFNLIFLADVSFPRFWCRVILYTWWLVRKKCFSPHPDGLSVWLFSYFNSRDEREKSQHQPCKVQIYSYQKLKQTRGRSRILMFRRNEYSQD